jgi:hypothetical protein
MTKTRSRLLYAPSFGARLLLILVGTAIGGAVLPARADIVTIWNEKAIELLPKMNKQGPFNLRGLARDTGSNHQTEEDTMKRIATSIVLLAGFSTLAAPEAFAQHSTTHVMMSPADLTWNDLPSLPGVKIAVIEGPLNAPVPIMFRLKFPANYKVPPHWHPGIEHITIISGTLNMGMVDRTGKCRGPLCIGTTGVGGFRSSFYVGYPGHRSTVNIVRGPLTTLS